MLRRVKNDLFDIASRIKEIDDGYFIVYNTEKERFEVHNEKQVINTLCLIVPYERLDIRTLELVRKTNISRVSDILSEIEKENARMEREKEKREKEERIANIERFLKEGKKW